MQVEVLYFDGCPTYREAEKILREETQELRFPGSPTLTVYGEDLFPVPDRAA